MIRSKPKPKPSQVAPVTPKQPPATSAFGEGGWVSEPCHPSRRPRIVPSAPAIEPGLQSFQSAVAALNCLQKPSAKRKEAVDQIGSLAGNEDRQILQLFEVQNLIGTLKGLLNTDSNDAGLLQSCYATMRMAYSASSRMAREVVNLKIYKSIVNSLRKFPKVIPLVQTAMDALGTIVNSSEVVDGLIVDRAYTVVVDILKSCSATLPVLTSGMNVLAVLLEKDYHACNVLVQHGELGVFTAPLADSRIYGEREVVLSTLHSLTALGNTCYYIHKQQTLSPASSPTASPSGGFPTSLLTQLLSSGTLGLVGALLDHYGLDETVVARVCAALEVVTSEAESFSVSPVGCLDYRDRPILQTTPLPTHVLRTLGTYINNPHIQCSGLKVLTNILAWDATVVMETADILDWLAAISRSMNVYRYDNMAVQVRGAECLASVLQALPDSKDMTYWLKKKIGGSRGTSSVLDGTPPASAAGREDFPLLELLKVNVGVHRVDCEVYLASCRALCHLMDSVGLHQQLLERGTDLVVMDGVKYFLDQARVPEHVDTAALLHWGVRALRIMVLNRKKQQVYLQRSGCILQLMAGIEGRYGDNEHILSEVFSVVACFAAVPKGRGEEEGDETGEGRLESSQEGRKDLPAAVWLRETAIELMFHSRALHSVEAHLSSQNFCEVVLELLCVLLSQYPQTDGLLYSLCERSTAERVAAIMTQHMKHYGIQRKAYLLIRILCSYSLFESTPKDFSLPLAKALVKSLLEFKEESALLEEGLQTVDMCCSVSGSLSRCLVEQDLHLVLVDVLQREEGGGQDRRTDLCKLATSIVYTLCCQQDFCNQLLVAMVRSNQVDGVRMLVDLGADVNCGEDPDTPICLATATMNLDMVDYLLNHGVSSVTKALVVAEDNSSDIIMARLLAHHTQTSANDTLCLSELNLSSLRPDWLVSLLEDTWSSESASMSRGRGGSFDFVTGELLKRRRSSAANISAEDLDRLKRQLMAVEESDYSEGEGQREGSPPNHRQCVRQLSPSSGGSMSPPPVLPSLSPPPSWKALGRRLSPVPQSPMCQTLALWPTAQSDHHHSDVDDVPAFAQDSASSTAGSAPPSPSHPHHSVLVVDPSSPSQRYSVSGPSTDPSAVPPPPRFVDSTPGSPPPDHCIGGGSVSQDSSLSEDECLRELTHDVTIDTSSVRRRVEGKGLRDQQQQPPHSPSTPESADPEWALEYSGGGGGGGGQLDTTVTGVDLPWASARPCSPVEQDCGDQTFLPPSPDLLRRYYEQALRNPSPASRTTPGNSRHESASDLGVKPGLTVLNLSSNQLESLSPLHAPRLLKKLRLLKEMDVSHNLLSVLPGKLFEELSCLAVLNAHHNALRQFPPAVLSCLLLTSLDLSHNCIEAFPAVPQALPHLGSLRLSHNSLREYPEGVNNSNFPRLTKVFLDNNRIASLPASHLKLDELQVLSVSKNFLEHLPKEFVSALRTVRVLNLSKNAIVQLPSEAAGYMGELEDLKVSWNKLGRSEGEFYGFVTLLPKLRKLDAAYNDITSVAPPWQWLSRGLKELFLNNNLIDKIDLTNGGVHWPLIERLHLGHNKLKSLPKELGMLRSLCTLDISHNVAISKLPHELGNLTQLFMLERAGLVKLDPSLLDVPTKSAISLLKSQLTRTVPYHCMKLMFIGAPGRGKTSLLQCVMKGAPLGRNVKKANLSTLGVRVVDWRYAHHSGATYNLKCWDFAGQEDFYSTHQCFLTSRSVFVLVYDFNRGLQELGSIVGWLLNINARAPQSQVIIVGTHRDLVPDSGYWPRHQEMRQKIKEFLKKPGFPHKIQFTEVSCLLDKPGMREFITTLKDTIDRAKLQGDRIMGGPISQSYLTLAEIVEAESKLVQGRSECFPVMHHSRLLSLMDQRGLVMAQEELQQAIKFLHDLGLVLHYTDLHSKLSDLYFLDPEWLCQLMGQVISVPEVNPILRARQGRLDISDFDLLLRPPAYPVAYREEYIRLLERFEVAIRQTQSSVLIPSHLPASKPDFVLPTGAQIVRRYKVCYIPPGFWPRLSTRLLAFNESMLAKSPTAEHVWSKGVCVHWAANAYYEIKEVSHPDYVIDITVAASRPGVRILCSVIDNVEALIDEWFPGLRDFDTTCGEKLVKPYAVCPNCSDPAHLFDIEDLIAYSETVDEVMCPVHKEMVSLEDLAPEVTISDLEPCFKLRPGDINLNEAASNCLGKGGFGEVYKAQYKGEAVAVKVFSKKFAEISGTTANHLLRQEVIILSQVDHPNIIRLVGVTLKPRPMLLLEYAEFGSLHKAPLETYSIRLKHSIAVQVASGLAYLHKNNIIYRDLKPDNILVFSPNITAPVNVKMSDYGISRYATVNGLKIDAGTVGNKAPELIRARSTGTPYTEKVDIFSYGLLLFYLVTNGHRPFEDLTSPFEKDRAFEEGYTIRDVEHYGSPPWPDMQELVKDCLEYRPALRPSAQQVYHCLCVVDFVGLKRMLPVHKETEIECCTTRVFREDNSANIEVWSASHVDQGTMCSIINLSTKGGQPAGMAVSSSDKVICITMATEQYVLMGTQRGKILVFHARERTFSHELCNLEDAVVCMAFFRCDDGCVLCAGVADGRVVRFPHSALQSSAVQGRTVELDGRGAPVRTLRKHRRSLLVCIGCEVVFVSLIDWRVTQAHRLLAKTNVHASCPITHLEVGLGLLWTAHRRSPMVHLWGLPQGHPKGQLACESIVRKQYPDMSPAGTKYNINSMLLQPMPNRILWVGLTSGHMILFNATTRLPLMVTHRHSSRLANMLSFRAQVMGKEMTLVVTGGFGFEASSSQSKEKKKGCHDNWGSLLVWDSAMVKQKPYMDDLLAQQLPYQ